MTTRVTVTVTLDVEHVESDERVAEADARLAAVQGVEYAVNHAQGEGFVHDRSDELSIIVAGVRSGTRYIKIEWDPDHDGGTFEGGVGRFVLLPADCNIEETFTNETDYPASCIIGYDECDLWDSDGNLLDSDS